MKPILFAALLCAAGLLLPRAHAQKTATQRKVFLEWKVEAERGDAEAQVALADFYASGQGVAKDLAEAVKWYRKAAEQRFPEAQVALGDAYASGQGVAKDHTEAVKWYRLAADQNVAEAQSNLGGFYCEGKGTKQDFVEGVRWFRKAAEQNFSAAQFNLGGVYREGLGVPKDQVESYAWYSLAAKTDKDAAEPRDALAKMMSPQELAKARMRTQELQAQTAITASKWEMEKRRKEAERRGYLLGKLKNPELFAAQEQQCEARRQELRPKAEQGDAKAQWQLGQVYSVGAPVGMKDDPEAIRWFRKAAEQNFVPALDALAYFYELGYGVARDEAEAMKWRRKAAEQNSTAAQLRLGFCYRDGKGVEKDEVEAYAWFDLAARSVRDAPRIRDELGSKMSPEQLAAGKKRAEELRAQIEAKLKGGGK